MVTASTPSGVMSRASLGLSTPYVVPEDNLEIVIAAAFAEVFELDSVGVNDDFFDLGGDSMAAANLSLLILERTGSDFPISSLIEHGSPRRIAALVRANSNIPAADAVEDTEGVRSPIFMVHGRAGFALPPAGFLEALAPGQRVRMFELPGIRGGRYYERIEDIASVYVKQLTDEYPRGPILLAAFCTGSLIAVEMAGQLAEIGRPPLHLVLLDPPVRRDGALGIDGKKYGKKSGYGRSQGWMKSNLRRIRAMLAPNGQEPLQDVDFAAAELRYRTKFSRKKREGRRKNFRYSEFNLSIDARAKLHVAFLRYRLRPYGRATTILWSGEREPGVRLVSQLDRFLPRRQVRVLADKHVSIANAAVASAMQAAFDAALANESTTDSLA